MSKFKDRSTLTLPGFCALLFLCLIGYLAYRNVIGTHDPNEPGYFWRCAPYGVALILLWASAVTLQPNEVAVLSFFGNYVGTVNRTGLSLVNPFTKAEKVVCRVENLQSPQLKVNDAHGNPIEIAAVIVWRVDHPADAVFEVADYEKFLVMQCETALRLIAIHFPYEPDHEGQIAIRSHPEEVSRALLDETQKRVSVAGITILEANLSHIAYSPEIAQAMLRRQQAQAIIAARQKIVDGAVGMVEMVLKRLEADGILQFDEHNKATMVNNLMMALVSEHHVQPVMSTAVPRA